MEGRLDSHARDGAQASGAFAAVDLRTAAHLLGGEVWGRDSVLCPGPSHSPDDRSLSVRFAGGNFTTHSFAGDPWPACRDHVAALLKLPAEWKRPSLTNVIRDMDTSASALRLWRETVSLPGTPGRVYLERERCVRYDGAALRWHTNCPFGPGTRVGCMVGLVRNIKTNEPQAIHRTAINPAGQKLSGMGNNGRLTLGPTRGGAIKLTDDADVERVIAIGEGIETALSIRRLPGLEQLPVWAVLNAGGIQAFPELRGIEAVWIATDHDKTGTGQKAALALAQRLEASGIEAITITPEAVGHDLNDRVRA
jgi:putative DNA primase/helicase